MPTFDPRSRQAERPNVPSRSPARAGSRSSSGAGPRPRPTRSRCSGAGVAFFGFLALFPTLIALVLAYGLFADPATIAAQVQSLGAALPPDVQKLITDQVTAQSQKTGALSVGLIISLVIALWSASGGVANLVQAINTAYDETDNRNVIKKRLLALGLTIGAIVFMIVLVTLIALLPIVFAFVEASSLRWVVQIVRWLLIAVLIMVALAVLYRLAPDRTVAKLAWTSPGAIVATVVWLLVSAGFSLYVTLTANSGYTKTYGALAGIVVLLMWLWLTSYAVLFGAEVNAETERQTLVDTTVGPDRPVGQRGAMAADDKNLSGTTDVEPEPAAEDPAATSRPARPRRRARSMPWSPTSWRLEDGWPATSGPWRQGRSEDAGEEEGGRKRPDRSWPRSRRRPAAPRHGGCAGRRCRSGRGSARPTRSRRLRDAATARSDRLRPRAWRSLLCLTPVLRADRRGPQTRSPTAR